MTFNTSEVAVCCSSLFQLASGLAKLLVQNHYPTNDYDGRSRTRYDASNSCACGAVLSSPWPLL
jgi:hypothetical protein